jgi:hypothetical protein
MFQAVRNGILRFLGNEHFVIDASQENGGHHCLHEGEQDGLVLLVLDGGLIAEELRHKHQ